MTLCLCFRLLTIATMATPMFFLTQHCHDYLQIPIVVTPITYFQLVTLMKMEYQKFAYSIPVVRVDSNH